jgi:hypothetical protein
MSCFSKEIMDNTFVPVETDEPSVLLKLQIPGKKVKKLY